LQNFAHLRRSKESGHGAKTRRRSQPKERKKSFSHPFHLRCCTRLKKCRANIAALVPLTGIEQHGLCSWVVVWTDDIVCSAILMLLVGSQLTSVWHLIVPLKVMFNTDASALAVPAAVLFVQWSHETDPNDRNRISSKTDVCFRQKWSVGSAESRGKPTRSTVDGSSNRASTGQRSGIAGRWRNLEPGATIWTSFARRRAAMEQHYVGLDVGLEETSLCIVDSEGKTIREVKVRTEPAAIRTALEGYADRLSRIGVEA
jgi:hypothetical protein